MVKINNAQIKHNGLLGDNSTKITLYLPELTDEQSSDLIKMAKLKTIGVVLMQVESLDDVSEVLQQAAEYAEEDGF